MLHTKPDISHPFAAPKRNFISLEVASAKCKRRSSEREGRLAVVVKGPLHFLGQVASLPSPTPLAAAFAMAVKGKGKQVAAESPGPGAGASGSGGKRRKGSGDAGAGPSSSSAAKRRRRVGVLQFVDDAAGVDDDYEEEEVLRSDEEASDPDDGEYGFGAVPEARLASCVGVWIGWMDRPMVFVLCNVEMWTTKSIIWGYIFSTFSVT